MNLKNKESYKKTLVAVLIIGMIFCLIISIINYRQYKNFTQETNARIEVLIERVKKEYPKVKEAELIEVLNSSEVPSEKTDKILRGYGIDTQRDSLVFATQNIYLRWCGIFAAATVCFVIAILIVFLRSEKEKSRKLREITGYLEEITRGNYILDLNDNTEDQLSMLKNDIYKITVLLREQAENSASDKMAVKDSISDISHQLKTPLTSIMIMIGILSEDENIDEEQRKQFIDEIKTQVLRINLLIQSLLKLTKFDANTIKFKRKNIEACDLVQDSLDNLESIIDEYGVNVSFNRESGHKIYCDPLWQREAIMNIIKNGCESSHPGGFIHIEISSNPIYTQIKIADNGKGISEKDQKHIFERFYKGENSSDEGCGIGMSLAKTIIEKDDGTISLKSQEGQGTEFIIKYFS